MAGDSTFRSQTVRRYLEGRGLSLDSKALSQFLAARLKDLTPPEAMVGRTETARRLAQAVREGESVVVFGDYDCDGMTSAAILTDALRKLGAKRVTPLVASRFSGGYGLSGPALERVLRAEPTLVVTCDCGSSDHAALRQLQERGIDAVVIDHHLVPAEPLPVLAFLNPHRPECGFPYKGLASCGLSLSVVAALRNELGKELDVRQWLDLVAIGTIADVAPLEGDNRALTRAGLELLAEAKRPGLRALFEVMGLTRGERLRASDVSFRLAPRLNAPGRLGPADIVLELLLSENAEQARGLAAEVERLCIVRREEQDRMWKEALAEAEKAPPGALVLGREGWNHGIVGIVAGRLAEERSAPTIVIGFEQGIGRGSARGPAGFPLFDAIAECSDCLVRFGGHQAAAGLELEISKLERFSDAFRQACARRTDFVPLEKVPTLELDPRDTARDVLFDLSLLEPCGEKNPRPELCVEALVRSSRVVKGDHLKLELRLPSGEDVAGFGPNLGSKVPEPQSKVKVVFDVREDRYRGGDAIELLVRKLSPS